MDYTPNMGSDLEMVRKSLYLEKLIRALLQHDGNPAIVGIEVGTRSGAACCRSTTVAGHGIADCCRPAVVGQAGEPYYGSVHMPNLTEVAAMAIVGIQVQQYRQRVRLLLLHVAVPLLWGMASAHPTALCVLPSPSHGFG